MIWALVTAVQALAAAWVLGVDSAYGAVFLFYLLPLIPQGSLGTLGKGVFLFSLGVLSLSSLWLLTQAILVDYGFYQRWAALVFQGQALGGISALAAAALAILLAWGRLWEGNRRVPRAESAVWACLWLVFPWAAILQNGYGAAISGVLWVVWMVLTRKRRSPWLGGLKSALVLGSVTVLCVLTAWGLSRGMPAAPSSGGFSWIQLVRQSWSGWSLDPSLTGWGTAPSSNSLSFNSPPQKSEKPVFRLRGSPGQVFYLGQETSSQLTEEGWIPDVPRSLESSESPVNPLRGSVELEFLGDFLSLIPFRLRDGEVVFLGTEQAFTFDSLGPGPGFANKLSPPLVGPFKFRLVSTQGFSLRQTQGPQGLHRELPPAFQLTAREVLGLQKAEETPVQALHRVLSLLKGGVYDLEARFDGTPAEQLAFFLRDPRGYCTQYATALAVLLRQAGLPSRLVTGYYAAVPWDRSETLIKFKNYHAWVEVWLEEQGWVTVDASPGFAGDYLGESGVWGLSSAESAPEVPGLESPDFNGYLPLVLGLLALGCLVGVAAVRLRQRGRRAAYSYDRSPNWRRLARNLEPLYARLEAQGVPRPEAIGLRRWGKEAGDLYPLLSGGFHDLVNLLEESLYGGVTPDRQAAHLAPRVLSLLRKHKPASLNAKS